MGTGIGVSVLEMVTKFEKVSGQKIPYQIVDRRTGDLPAFWAKPDLAASKLGWSAKRSVTEMCKDAWKWVSPKN